MCSYFTLEILNYLIKFENLKIIKTKFKNHQQTQRIEEKSIFYNTIENLEQNSFYDAMNYL